MNDISAKRKEYLNKTKKYILKQVKECKKQIRQIEKNIKNNDIDYPAISDLNDEINEALKYLEHAATEYQERIDTYNDDNL